MTEEQSYTVLASHGGVELRRYDACVVADVAVAGSMEQAGNRAFSALAGYINGRNRAGDRLAMTAPVVQQSEGRRLDMTAPVIQEATAGGRWVVSFVLPGAGALADYPEPLDARVSLRALPAEEAVALRWSGRWTRANVERHTRALLDAAAQAGWTPNGAVRWARFDPPWKPPFARRNEVVLPVVAPE